MYRSRLEAQAAIIEDTDVERTSTPEVIDKYSAGVRLDRPLYEELKQRLNIRGALDIYLMMTRAGAPK